MTEIAEIVLEPLPDPFWRVLKQIGVDSVVGVLPRGMSDWRAAAGELPWEYGPLALYKHRLEEAGFSLAVIEDNPPMDALRLGTPNREEELEQFCTLVRSMGQLGIPVLCFHWMPVFGWLRTSVASAGRGGAYVTAYDHSVLAEAPETHVGVVTEERLWANLRWFLERVLPVAEESGVKLALHPDDPPVTSVRGIARIMNSLEAFERVLDLVPSESIGITLCQGNFALMTDDLPAAIRQFGERNKIFFVHFRDVTGTRESFVETFHDDGKTDMLACLRAYREVNYVGVLRSDHVPTLEGDTAKVPGYSNQARLFAIGYITGLLEAVVAETRTDGVGAPPTEVT